MYYMYFGYSESELYLYDMMFKSSNDVNHCYILLFHNVWKIIYCICLSAMSMQCLSVVVYIIILSLVQYWIIFYFRNKI